MNTKPRKRKVHLILNGKGAHNEALRSAIVGQREAGHRIEVRVTWEKGDAQRFVSQADGVDLLVAAGGDGTLNEASFGRRAARYRE
jgi:diacylglycerol kinase family enzyme